MFPTIIWSGLFFPAPFRAPLAASTERSRMDLPQWSPMGVNPTEVTYALALATRSPTSAARP